MANEPHTLQARALRRAADILGGKDKLRATLRVPMASLEQWLAGKALPPMDVFLRAVDIISTPTSNRTPTAASVRARLLSRQSGDLINNTKLTIARSRALRGQPRSASFPKVTRFLEAAFRKDERPAVLEAALDAALEAADSPMGNLQLKTSDGLRIVAHRGFRTPFLEFFACVTHDVGTCGTALKNGARVIVSDVAADPIFAGTDAARAMEDAGARACQSTPLVSASGEVLGMLSTHYEDRRIAPTADLDAVERIARCASSWLVTA